MAPRYSGGCDLTSLFLLLHFMIHHKAVNNTAPEYLCDLIRLNVKSTTIRTCASFDPCLLCVPPISKTCANSKYRHGHLIHAHIPPLSNCKDTGEEPSSIHNSKHTKGPPCNTGTKHNTHIKQHRIKGVQPNGLPMPEQSL